MADGRLHGGVDCGNLPVDAADRADHGGHQRDLRERIIPRAQDSTPWVQPHQMAQELACVTPLSSSQPCA